MEKFLVQVKVWIFHGNYVLLNWDSTLSFSLEKFEFVWSILIEMTLTLVVIIWYQRPSRGGVMHWLITTSGDSQDNWFTFNDQLSWELQYPRRWQDNWAGVPTCHSLLVSHKPVGSWQGSLTTRLWICLFYKLLTFSSWLICKNVYNILIIFQWHLDRTGRCSTNWKDKQLVLQLSLIIIPFELLSHQH